jgi:hypothetical protein
MKLKFLSVVLAAGLSSGVAHAQTNIDQENVSIAGNVAGLCILGAPSRSAVDLQQLINTSGARVGRLATIGNQQITLPGSFCNFAGTNLRVSAQALIASDASEVQQGFARAVNFTSTVSNWATSNAVATTAATAGGATPSAVGTGGNQPAPKLADLTLTLNGFAVPSDLLLVAGRYEGTVTVTLGPTATP